MLFGMSRNHTCSFVTLSLLVFLSMTSPLIGLVADQTEPISIDLVNAPTRGVLESFARIAEAELDIELPGVSELSIRVDGVRWTTALDAVCQTASCQWRLVEENGVAPRLEVRPQRREPQQPISVDLQQAPPKEVLKSLATALDAQLQVSRPIESRDLPALSLTLERVEVTTALEAVCESLGCRWQLEGETPRVLRVDWQRAPERPAPVDLATPINLSLAEANGAEVMASVASVVGLELEWEDWRQAGAVTLELEAEPVRQVLDRLCDQLHCRWFVTTRSNGRRSLEVEPLSD